VQLQVAVVRHSLQPGLYIGRKEERKKGRKEGTKEGTLKEGRRKIRN
jgi:hypothetical protein